ncbi:MAG: M24 family metallopeptidase [Tidjanibacter sp.]|nr:M24 family metallopeptidase [Tidjanibacter sp.]
MPLPRNPWGPGQVDRQPPHPPSKSADQPCRCSAAAPPPYQRGIAFPCSISLDGCCGYFCPLKEDKSVMKKGQLAKIELGAHVSGFIAEVCDTIVIGETATEEQKKVIEAGYTALQAVISKLKPGVNTNEITAVVDEICKKYEVKAFENIVSRNMERYMIDGHKFILNVPSKAAVDEMTIEKNDVWNLDIILSTGPCKPYDNGTRTTVFKRNVDETYIFSRLRAIETRRWVCRAANTGISGFITPKGEVVQSLGWDQRGVLTQQVVPTRRVTFYATWGDYLGRLGGYVFLLCLLYYVSYRVRKKNHLIK